MPGTVLFISYFFPPVGGGGVQRTTKFVRYLPDFGWEPLILTVKNPAYATFDPSLLDELPDDLVIEYSNAFQITALYFRLKRRSSEMTADTKSPKTAATTSLKSQIFRQIRRIGRTTLQYTMIPDDKIGWVPYALRRAKQMIAAHNPAAIYTTSSPFSAHIIGAKLSRQTGLPWIADFRDPYVADARVGPHTAFHRTVRSYLERGWVRQATRVITTTDRTTADFQARYPEQPSEKWVTITNGYDESDFADLPTQQNDHFTIAYVGSLYHDAYPRPDPIFRAVRALIDHDPAAAESVRITFTGRLDRVYATYIDEDVQRYNLHNIVTVEPPVSHHEAIQRMCRAATLLLMLVQKPGTDLVLHGKIFEYLRAERPIVATLPPGASWDILAGRENVYLCAPDDHITLTETIRTLFTAWKNGNLPNIQQPDVTNFERRALTGKLAELFDNLKAND